MKKYDYVQKIEVGMDLRLAFPTMGPTVTDVYANLTKIIAYVVTASYLVVFNDNKT